MDDAPDISNYSSVATVVMLCAYFIYKVFKKSRCKSHCCGQKTSVQIDLENTNSKDSPLISRDHEAHGSLSLSIPSDTA